MKNQFRWVSIPINVLLLFGMLTACVTIVSARTVAGGVSAKVFSTGSADIVARLEHEARKTSSCSILAYDRDSKGYKFKSGFLIPSRLPTHGIVSSGTERLFIAWEYVEDLDAPILSVYSFAGNLIKQIRLADIFTSKQMDVFQANKKGADITWFSFMYLDAKQRVVIITTVKETVKSMVPLIVTIDEAGRIHVGEEEQE
ncbi:MAG: hypothetical protein ABI273_11645 [Lacunisphaera sp.]